MRTLPGDAEKAIPSGKREIEHGLGSRKWICKLPFACNFGLSIFEVMVGPVY
jgi:hypothetical protein